eukprot:TRINITY_DN3193_c4_g11_i1.p1 TRINITY_DN3193_c4_g11~~TRINITY_DN3193_c4_g11_i1.p1  ORF type:complete len:396 (+),score=89.08 TRINITY_DN3193_c4_g11_i1:46-1188(+)
MTHGTIEPNLDPGISKIIRKSSKKTNKRQTRIGNVNKLRNNNLKSYFTNEEVIKSPLNNIEQRFRKKREENAKKTQTSKANSFKAPEPYGRHSHLNRKQRPLKLFFDINNSKNVDQNLDAYISESQQEAKTVGSVESNDKEIMLYSIQKRQDVEDKMFTQTADIRTPLPSHFPKYIPNRSQFMPKSTLVLDLDETLVHSIDMSDIGQVETTDFSGFDYFDFRVSGWPMRCILRPGLTCFLKDLSKIFEIIVFTAGMQEYADIVIDRIDPDRRFIQHRLYREHCNQIDNYTYLKDIRVCNRNLNTTIIVENSLVAVRWHLDNAVIIRSFFAHKDQKKDNSLKLVQKILLEAIEGNKVQNYLISRFKLSQLVQQYENFNQNL